LHSKDSVRTHRQTHIQLTALLDHYR